MRVCEYESASESEFVWVTEVVSESCVCMSMSV